MNTFICENHNQKIVWINLNIHDNNPIKCKLCINNTKKFNEDNFITIEEFISIHNTALKDIEYYKSNLTDNYKLINSKAEENLKKLTLLIDQIKNKTVENINNIFSNIKNNLDIYINEKNKYNLNSIKELIYNTNILKTNQFENNEFEDTKVGNLDLNLTDILKNKINNYHKIIDNNQIYKNIFNKFNNNWDSLICKIEDSDSKINDIINKLNFKFKDYINITISNNEISKKFIKFPLNLSNEINLFENSSFDFLNKNDFNKLNKLEYSGFIELGKSKLCSINNISISNNFEILTFMKSKNKILVWKINKLNKEKIYNNSNIFNWKLDNLKENNIKKFEILENNLILGNYNNKDQLNIFNLKFSISFDNNWKITSSKFDDDNIILIITNNGLLIKFNYIEKFIVDHNSFGFENNISDIYIFNKKNCYLIIINDKMYKLIDKFNFEELYTIELDFKPNYFSYIDDFNFISFINNKKWLIYSINQDANNSNIDNSDDEYFNIHSGISHSIKCKIIPKIHYENILNKSSNIQKIMNSSSSTNNCFDFILIYNNISFIYFFNTLTNNIIYKFESSNINGISSIFILCNKINLNFISDAILDLLKKKKFKEIDNYYTNNFINNVKLWLFKKKGKASLIYNGKLINSINIIEKKTYLYKNNLNENFLFIYGEESNKIELIYLD